MIYLATKIAKVPGAGRIPAVALVANCGTPWHSRKERCFSLAVQTTRAWLALTSETETVEVWRHHDEISDHSEISGLRFGKLKYP